MLAATAARLKKRAAIAVRVNPDVSAKTHPYISTGLHRHKFGVPIPEAKALYAQAAQLSALKVAGVSVHIGSQITDVDTFREALERVVNWLRSCARRDTTSAISMPEAAWEFPTLTMESRRRPISRSRLPPTPERCWARCVG